jgi:hypothetical protein
VRSKGRFFDLNTLFDQVNGEYFANEIDCPITWGANRRVRNQNSIKLASYSDRTKTIRVSPALDKSYVPKYVIMGIVYHEMLRPHQKVPPTGSTVSPLPQTASVEGEEPA